MTQSFPPHQEQADCTCRDCLFERVLQVFGVSKVGGDIYFDNDIAYAMLDVLGPVMLAALGVLPEQTESWIHSLRMGLKEMVARGVVEDVRMQ